MNMREFFAFGILASMLTLTAVAGAANDGGVAAETIAFVRRGNIWVSNG